MSRAVEQMAALQYNLAMVASRRRGGISSVTDLGELAVRLGSIVTFDRRGDVYWLDGFEEGVAKFAATAVGTGAGVALALDYCRSGNWSCGLTAGSDAGHYAKIARLFPYPALSRWGFECSWSFDSDLERFEIGVEVDDGSGAVWTGVLSYLLADEKLQYKDADTGTWADLATSVKLYDDYGMFNGMKLVLDLVDGEYERAILNESEYDMNGLALEEGVSAVETPLIRLTLQNTGDSGKNSIVYVDDVIVTQNEPGRSEATGRTLKLVGSG